MTELTTIPGSFTDESVRRLRWIRRGDIDQPEVGIKGRCYTAEVSDGLLKAIVSQDEVEPGKKLWHLSVSHSDKCGMPDRVPSFDELKHAKYMLLPKDIDITMVLIFPRRLAPYVNEHATCLHLWETEQELDI